MARVIHAPPNPATLHEGARATLAAWSDSTRHGLSLALANRLFGERTFPFDWTFRDFTRTWYGAPFEPTDFVRDAEGSRSAINEWVESQTQHHIRNVVPAGAVTPDTRLVLACAMYFRSAWEQPFDPELTRAAPFFAGGTREVEVPTMHLTEKLRFSETWDLQMLELPCEGGEFVMTILLPKKRTWLAAIEAKLTAEALRTWLEELQTVEVQVSLPKFRVAPEHGLELGSVLRALGMVDAFDERADFSGIASPSPPAERLFLPAVFHGAFVEVDERGTEAAAASVVDLELLSDHVAFRADHPFLFLIRDRRSGAVLFLGRVDDPSAA
jgi:serpin B